MFALHKFIPQIEEKRQALFVGFFGPIGVSAVFYIYISLEFFETITVDGVIREDAERLSGTLYVVVWFLAICSIVVHGLSIPLGKFGFYLPRTISRALTTESNDEPAPFRISDREVSIAGLLRERRRRHNGSGTPTPASASRVSVVPERHIQRIGGTVIRDGQNSGGPQELSSIRNTDEDSAPNAAANRTIRFPDDDQREG